MKKDTIIQFVCFITELDFDPFVTKWETYAKKLMTDHTKMALQEAVGKGRFRYISQHECADRDFKFTFMNARRSDDLPEHHIKIIQAGGYSPLQTERKRGQDKGDLKLIAFISHEENDLDFYRNLPGYSALNIYEAYYENCAYGFIMEYFVPEGESFELLAQLKQRPGVISSQYKESLVPQL